MSADSASSPASFRLNRRRATSANACDEYVGSSRYEYSIGSCRTPCDADPERSQRMQCGLVVVNRLWRRLMSSATCPQLRSRVAGIELHDQWLIPPPRRSRCAGRSARARRDAFTAPPMKESWLSCALFFFLLSCSASQPVRRAQPRSPAHYPASTDFEDALDIRRRLASV